MRLLIAGLLVCSAFAQEQTTIRSTTEEVLLDLVVRDKGQRMVRDLSAGDIEIYEDGVRQTVRSFRFVEGKRPEGTPQGSTPAGPGDALREINLVTIVVEAMNHDGLRLARQVVNEFLDHDLHSNTYAAVFTLNNRLALLQPYTGDVKLIRAAMDLVSEGRFQAITRKSNEEMARLVQLVGSGDVMQAQSEKSEAAQRYQGLQLGSAEDRGPQVDWITHSALLQARRLEMRAIMHQQGAMSLDAIRRLISVLADLPGRKTVLYLSDGLPVSPGIPDWFRNVISEANRANVTFYTVDTRGLTTASPNQLASAAAGAVNRLERVEVAGTNMQQNLFALAEDTGGFAMANSNDLRLPMRKVMEDVRSHYELTYTPTSTTYDGHFRRIEVKLKRPGLRAQSRDGYFALPALRGRGLLPFEFAVLRAMDAKPQSFAYRAAALRMRPMLGQIGHTVVFEIPASALRFGADEKKKTFTMHASMLGLIRDADGQVVEKVSRDLAWSGPAEKTDEYRAGNIVVRLPVELSPGRYSLETGVVDRIAATASTRRSVLIVAPPESLPVGDPVLVRRVDPGDTDKLDPFAFRDGVITPDLSASGKEEATVYLAAWPRNGEPVRCSIELRHNGTLVGSAQPEVPPADDTGTVRMLLTLPAKGLGPGQLEAAITLEQGNKRTLRRTTINMD